MNNEQMNEQLFEVLASLDTKEKALKFMEDLCTQKEIEHMAQRVESAKLLLNGKTYTQVIESCSISSATLSRVNRCIEYGTGGYNQILKEYFENK